VRIVRTDYGVGVADVLVRRRGQIVQGGGEMRRQQRAQDGLVEVDEQLAG
jgi:hypothetical protein